MADKQSNAPPPMLSLYDDLVGSANPNATISAAPVLYKKDDAQDVKSKLAKIQQSLNAARPQPKRPTQAKPGFRPKIPSSAAKSTTSSSSALPGVTTSSPAKKDVDDPAASNSPAPPPPPPGPKSGGIEDWVGGDEWYDGPSVKRERGGRKKRKKEKELREREEQNWDAVYDPTRPTNYEAYKDSDERIRELEDWMAVLRGGRRRRDSSRMSSRSGSEEYARQPNKMFAPPSMNFAPPASLDIEPPTERVSQAANDDPFARRAQMSGMSGPPRSPSPPSAFKPSSDQKLPSEPSCIPPPPPPPSAPQFQPGVVISAEPVRYTLPPPPADLPANEEELQTALANLPSEPPEGEEPVLKSNRPGQKGFAARYMAKHGYQKGTGLGAQGTGILSALAVKVDKNLSSAPKKKYDEEGQLISSTAAKSMGKIVGGKKKKGTEDAKMSSVVRCLHMVDGRDLDYEMGPEGNLVEEIGQGCGERYGNIERVLVWRGAEGLEGEKRVVPVFLKFTAQISALRAVAALDGTEYGGNIVKAEFWDEDRFENGEYV